MEANKVALSIALSPTGHLALYADTETVPKAVADQLHAWFAHDSSIGLLRLGITNFNESLPLSIGFWQQFAQLFITEVCKHTHANEKVSFKQLSCPIDEINKLCASAPFIRGIEYLKQEHANTIWLNLITSLESELTAYAGKLEPYLATFNKAWNTIGRVCFHLAENKANSTYPFAFLATYTTSLSNNIKTQHVPLGKALEEYASLSKKELLLALLLPVHLAVENSVFLKALVDTGKVFHPQAWKANEAYQFLKDIPVFEAAGIIVRVPNWWSSAKPPRPTIKVTIGQKTASQVGLGALLDFNMNFALSTGESLTAQEFNQLLQSAGQLVQIKGQWVQVDNAQLNEVLAHWKTIERQVKKQGLSFAEGLRILAGVAQAQAKDVLPEEIVTWSTVVEGDWLNATLAHLRGQNERDVDKLKVILKPFLKAELRNYQQRGVEWLWWLYNMRLGGCLADDMGLGKTIQIIALLLLVKQQKLKSQQLPRTHLLVLPASLLGNWQAEIARFAPTLSVWVAHGSTNRGDTEPILAEVDVVITTYGTLTRLDWLSTTAWDLIILDEAQAIKNPTAKQTSAIKLFSSQVRFALTGTPIENRLLDLWSLFDFVAPGLLGASKTFADYSKKKSVPEHANHSNNIFYAAVRRLVSPYILRRLKSDKQIINDLPDKTEMQTYCILTKQQVALYQQAVNELSKKLKNQVNGINRRGLVMAYLLRFKQICNHPCQWLGHGEYAHNMSGKFLRLKELCEVIEAKQEKVLVFTQFREIIPALCTFLAEIFNREGLFIHGQTSVKERVKRVESFQQEQGEPFLVLSLKAGGVGLNLTAASHVIHFDRWWNPAVENQATDRAFRIGQKKNVLVHKFICQGTIEEKIDSMLLAKSALSNDILGQKNEVVFTELSNAELMDIVTLDIHRALGEN